ncbi:MAG: hypothetical protein FWD00_04100 [Clostridiales bacterium]|nr:hypothetical protein [Clostridiales bacterium]
MGKFKIPVVPATTNKSIRFPNDIIEDVQELIDGKPCTFTAFTIEAVRSAIRSVKEESEEYKVQQHPADSKPENNDK